MISAPVFAESHLEFICIEAHRVNSSLPLLTEALTRGPAHLLKQLWAHAQHKRDHAMGSRTTRQERGKAVPGILDSRPE